MFKNYLKVGIRNILKNKVFSFINIFGLALAMSICMLIILMLGDQGRYDQFHSKKDRIYRILSDANKRLPYATTPYPVASVLKAEYPTIEESTNLTPGVGGDGMYKERVVEMRGYFTDPSFFDVFGFELAKGDKHNALEKPNSMIISKIVAEQLFPNEDPIGKVIEFSDRALAFPEESDGIGSPSVQWGSFSVTGVLDETLYKSHVKFDVLVSSSSLRGLIAEGKVEDNTNNWERYYRTYTYVVLKPDKNRADLANALTQLVKDKYAGIVLEQTKDFKLVEQRIDDIQLDLASNDTSSRFPRIGYYFLSFLGAVIMISAILNYTTLTIARALTRAKEIGVRKVGGAGRKTLMLQFLSESIITAMLALIMAIILLFVIRPGFTGLWINQFLNFELPSTISAYLIFVAFAVFIGIVAGLYPSLHLSTYEPINALKGVNNVRPGKLRMRKVLAITQFTVSLFFITTSILIFNQFKHFVEFDYGFNSKNIINIEMQGVDYRTLVNEIGSIPGISIVSACDYMPATGTQNRNEFKTPGAEEGHKATVIIADENFVNSLEIKLVAGRLLTMAKDSSDQFILVNEATVREFGFKDPSEIIGQALEDSNKEMLEVVGVVKDFSLRVPMAEDKIDPFVLRNSPYSFKYVNVRIASVDPSGVIERVEAKWKNIDPIHPLKYKYFDDQLSATNQGIFDVVSILGFIAFLAITIACLGLLGMTTYTAERKAKEVGIRKILGAGDSVIALLLAKEFLIVLGISICIGATFSYFLNNLWLQKFPNRVDFGFGTIFLSVFILLVLGLITIGSQTIRASRRNPIDAIRND